MKEKEYYKEMNIETPTISFRVDKDEMAKWKELAKNLKITKSMLGRSIIRSIMDGVTQGTLEINPNENTVTIGIKFKEDISITKIYNEKVNLELRKTE